VSSDNVLTAWHNVLTAWRISHNWLRSEPELLYDYHFVLATSPLRLRTSNIFFQINICGHRPYVTSSLTRGWVCHLQLLLALASAVIVGSESSRTDDHILLSQTRDFPNLDIQVPIFIFPRSRVARIYPQALSSLFVASYDSQGYGGV
jgi:hypothetical protein